MERSGPKCSPHPAAPGTLDSRFPGPTAFPLHAASPDWLRGLGRRRWERGRGPEDPSPAPPRPAGSSEAEPRPFPGAEPQLPVLGPQPSPSALPRTRRPTPQPPSCLTSASEGQPTWPPSSPSFRGHRDLAPSCNAGLRPLPLPLQFLGSPSALCTRMRRVRPRPSGFRPLSRPPVEMQNLLTWLRHGRVQSLRRL